VLVLVLADDNTVVFVLIDGSGRGSHFHLLPRYSHMKMAAPTEASLRAPSERPLSASLHGKRVRLSGAQFSREYRGSEWIAHPTAEPGDQTRYTKPASTRYRHVYQQGQVPAHTVNCPIPPL